MPGVREEEDESALEDDAFELDEDDLDGEDDLGLDDLDDDDLDDDFDDEDDEQDEEALMKPGPHDAAPPKDRRPRGGRGDDDMAADRLVPREEDREIDLEAHQEELLDEGVEETFPASDPVSVKRIT